MKNSSGKLNSALDFPADAMNAHKWISSAHSGALFVYCFAWFSYFRAIEAMYSTLEMSRPEFHCCIGKTSHNKYFVRMHAAHIIVCFVLRRKLFARYCRMPLKFYYGIKLNSIMDIIRSAAQFQRQQWRAKFRFISIWRTKCLQLSERF